MSRSLTGRILRTYVPDLTDGGSAHIDDAQDCYAVAVAWTLGFNAAGFSGLMIHSAEAQVHRKALRHTWYSCSLRSGFSDPPTRVHLTRHPAPLHRFAVMRVAPSL